MNKSKKSSCQLKKGIICLSLAADSSCSQTCPGWAALGHCSSAPLFGGTEGQTGIKQTIQQDLVILGAGLLTLCPPVSCAGPSAPSLSPASLTLQPREPELPSPFSLDEPDKAFLFPYWSGPSSNPFREAGIAHEHTELHLIIHLYAGLGQQALLPMR